MAKDRPRNREETALTTAPFDQLLSYPVGCAFLLTIARDQVPLDLALTPRESFSRLATVLRHITPWSGTFDRDTRAVLSLAPRLLDLASGAVAHPGGRWWTAPIDRSQQVLMLMDPEPDMPPPQIGSAWESYAERPLGWRVTSTMNIKHSCLDTIMASGVGDWPQVQRRRFRAEINDSARVLEITSPVDWHSLCVAHPQANQHRNSPAGVGTLTPDWHSVATQWDGIHLTFMALLTVPFVRYTSDEGTTMMWSWDTEGTIWLPGGFLRAGAPLQLPEAPTEHVRPLMSADLEVQEEA